MNVGAIGQIVKSFLIQQLDFVQRIPGQAAGDNNIVVCEIVLLVPFRGLLRGKL